MAQIGAIKPHTLDAFRKAFGFLRDGVFWVSEKGEIVAANQALSDFLAYDPEELGELLIFAIHPHLNLLSWKKIWRSLQSGELVSEDTELMNASGVLIPMRTSMRMVNIDGVDQAMVVVENQLLARQLPDLLEAAGRAGNLGLWELDLIKDQYTFMGAVQDWLNIKPEEAILPSDEARELVKDFLSAIDLQRLEQELREAIRSGKSFETELMLHQSKASGSLRLIITGQTLQSELQTIKVYGTVRRAATESLNDVKDYLTRLSLDHADDLILWVRPDDTLAYVNQSVIDRLGYDRADMIGRPLADLLVEKENAEDRWQTLRDKKVIIRELELKSKKGNKIPVVSTVKYVSYQGKEYACIFARDITIRQKQAQQLQLTQFSIEYSRDMVLWVMPDGTIIYANRAFSQKTGYAPEVVNELNLYNLYIDKDVPLDREAIWTQLKKERDLELEVGLRTKSGEVIPVYCTLNYICYQDQEFECVFMRDWSKKRARDVKLMLAQNTLDSARDMIFWIDEDMHISYCNPAATRSLGYSKEQLKGKSVAKICSADRLKTLLRSGKKIGVELSFITSQNETMPVEISISPVSLKGQVYQCLIARDISERKEREQELVAKQHHINELSSRLQDENIMLKHEINQVNNLHNTNIVTQNKDYHKVLDQVAQVADTDATVLILGETGTGKELLARAIYSLSERDEKPLITVNCAALPENLIESELFGHEKGAFTGALQQKKGRFELANGGTIFLDEIGELPLDLQSKLLRVLQEGEFERVGGTTTIKVDLRVIAATNRNLEKMIEEGTFREDLFYRLNVFPITNPPLRARRDDIPLLVWHFSKKFGERMGKKIETISQVDMEILQQYDFPGNVRELENIVERAVILAKDGILNLRDSFDRVKEQSVRKTGKSKKFFTFEEMQREHIIEALRHTNWRITGPQGAAKLLDLNDRTLMSKMRKLGIHRKDFV